MAEEELTKEEIHSGEWRVLRAVKVAELQRQAQAAERLAEALRVIELRPVDPRTREVARKALASFRAGSSKEGQ